MLRATRQPLIVSDRASIRFLAGVGLLRRDLPGLRHSVPYLRSLLPGKSALADGVPMMPFGAIAWLRAYVRPGMKVFEYGSGGSTIFFARHVGHIVSIEHDPEWYERTAEQLASLPPGNSSYVLQPPDEGAKAKFGSTDERYRGMNFESYVKTIDDYADEHFDLVVVDGRARTACVLRALPKVRRGGFLLLDDSYRGEYSPAMAALAGQGRNDFRGLAPYNTDLGQTTVWEIQD
jgi:predicted O-methyltransferase YrrM